MHDYTALQVLWFVLIGVLWVGYFVLEGFDFGVGMLLRVLGRDRRRAASADPHDRPGLGRQRGLAARRGRCHLRRVPAVVRDALLGLLHRALPRPRRADRARRRVRVLGQARKCRPGSRPGSGRSRSAASWPRCSGVSPGRTSSTACRSTRAGNADGSLTTLLNPYAILGGVTTVLLFLALGATFLHAADEGRADRAGEPVVARRLRRPPPCAGIAFLVWTIVDQPHQTGDRDRRHRARDRSRWPRTRSPSFGTATGLAFALGAPRSQHSSRRSSSISSRTRWSRPRSGVQPDAERVRLLPLHAHGDDGRRRDPAAGRARLPGVDVLGVPPPDRAGGLRRRRRATRSTCSPAAAKAALPQPSSVPRVDRQLLRFSRSARVPARGRRRARRRGRRAPRRPGGAARPGDRRRGRRPAAWPSCAVRSCAPRPRGGRGAGARRRRASSSRAAAPQAA